MKLKGFSKVVIFLVVVALSASLCSANVILGGMFESKTSFSGRNLLQDKTPCPVSFEFKNYTGLTSRCKAPNYPPEQCCPAFKEFACPYADQLNNLSTDCSASMFYYINLHGKYPIGLFGDQCKEGIDGLSCPSPPPASATGVNSSPRVLIAPLLWLRITAAALAFLKLF